MTGYTEVKVTLEDGLIVTIESLSDDNYVVEGTDDPEILQAAKFIHCVVRNIEINEKEVSTRL